MFQNLPHSSARCKSTASNLLHLYIVHLLKLVWELDNNVEFDTAYTELSKAIAKGNHEDLIETLENFRLNVLFISSKASFIIFIRS